MKQFSVTHHLTYPPIPPPPSPKVALQSSLFHLMAYFTLLDSDTDSDSNLDCKSNVHNVLCKTFYTALSQNQIPSPSVNYTNGIRIEIRIGIRICECKQAITNTKTVVSCRVSVNRAKFERCAVLLNYYNRRHYHCSYPIFVGMKPTQKAFNKKIITLIS